VFFSFNDHDDDYLKTTGFGDFFFSNFFHVSLPAFFSAPATATMV
jgi:hypothetical protein